MDRTDILKFIDLIVYDKKLCAGSAEEGALPL
jgi:hypothetical protein